MTWKTSSKIILMAAVAGLIMAGCKGKKADATTNGENILNARAMSDPDMLNPINLTSTDGRYTAGLIFMMLNGTDPKDYHLTPALVKERAKISEVTEGEWKGGIKLEYELRPEATWDNGTPVTASDYAFTLKTILNPNTKCVPLRPYYEWLADVVIDSANPRKFTVYAKEKYFMIEEFAGTYVLPEYVYDPEHIMAKFSIKDMNTNEKRAKLKENADIRKFADLFNSEKFQREKGGIVGCGPYEFVEWKTGQNITLVRKKNWWGDKINDSRDFIAYPDKIVFKVINDPNTAVTALKDGQVDEINGVDPKLFEELLKNETAKQKLKLDAPSIFAFTYLGFNMKNPKLSDKKVRLAIAHCVNRQQVNEVINFNKNTICESFVHPTQKHFNKDIQPIAYDLDAARKLLDEAGWKDSDGDGFRDKVLNGEKTKLAIEFKVNAGNKAREQTGIMLKEDLKKVGIDLNIVTREWSVYIQDMDKKNFEMSYGGYSMSSTMGDPKQMWHTASQATGGSNMFSYGNAESDKLIEDIRKELDENKRIEMYKKLEVMIHDEVPCVFMFIPANRLAINKRYTVEETLLNPGFIYNEMKLATNN
jgi:peptide/nickel transport system substrate-binding protein